MLDATPRRIHNPYLDSVIGAKRGAPWTRTKHVRTNASASHWILFVPRIWLTEWLEEQLFYILKQGFWTQSPKWREGNVT